MIYLPFTVHEYAIHRARPRRAMHPCLPRLVVIARPRTSKSLRESIKHFGMPSIWHIFGASFAGRV